LGRETAVIWRGGNLAWVLTLDEAPEPRGTSHQHPPNRTRRGAYIGPAACEPRPTFHTHPHRSTHRPHVLCGPTPVPCAAPPPVRFRRKRTPARRVDGRSRHRLLRRASGLHRRRNAPPARPPGLPR